MAAPTVVSRVISAVTDNRAVLSNGQFGRELPFSDPTDWSKIRIGVRWHATDPGADIIGTPRLAVGVCNGTAVGSFLGDGTTLNWVGVRTKDTVWSRTAEDLLIDGVMWVNTKRVGSTVTESGAGYYSGVQWGIGNGAAVARADRTIFFVDILKGSPNYTLQLFGWINATPVNDVSEAAFLAQMEVLGTPVLAQHTFSTAQTIAADESTGAFNTLNIMWGSTAAAIEICDLAVARLA